VTTNSAPVIAAATSKGAVTEWQDRSAAEAANTAHTVTGSLSYSDANASDTHTASFKALGSGYLGTFSLNTSQLDSADTLGWSFSVSDSAMEFLNRAQTITQAYEVKISDGHGGTVVQTITITLTGAADPVRGDHRRPDRGSGSDTGNAHGTDLAGDGVIDGDHNPINDQMPTPKDWPEHSGSQHAGSEHADHRHSVPDLVKFLGAHLHFPDHLV
jgi:VCBS repeat-containing protein